MNGIKTDPQNDCCRTSLSEERQLEKWLPLVRSRANAFRQSGIEPEDLIQEGLIGLLYAVRAFKADCGATFETFAYVCITNRLRSAVVRLGKQLSLASPEGDMADMAKFLNSDGEEDPQELFISEEQAQNWLERADKLLSPMENRVMRLYLGGYSYQEMAAALDSTPKSVDNALCRARKKLRGE